MIECACPACVACCHRSPGWLTPRDVRRLARSLGVTEAALFRTHLAIDFYTDHEPSLPVPLPATDHVPAGTRVYRGHAILDPPVPHMRCHFLTKEDRCSVHSVKPRECRDSVSVSCKQHDNSVPALARARRAIARTWDRPGVQKWLEDLLTEAGLDAASLMIDPYVSPWGRAPWEEE